MKIGQIDFSKIPTKPGVYFYKDRKNKVLYVGKAINLKARIRQYFDKGNDLKTKLMVENAFSVDFKETPSTFLASLLEARLIKEYQPKYNVLLKDDKRFLYLGITKEDYPRVKLFRRPELENLLFYLGPFPSSAAIRDILRVLRRIFPFCSCKTNRGKSCLYYQMGLCLGPGLVEKKTYQKMIKRLVMLLSGSLKKLFKLLRKEMETSAKKLDYEKASEIKKKILLLEGLISSSFGFKSENLEVKKGLVGLKKMLIKVQNIDPSLFYRIESYDVANFGGKIIVGAFSVLENGEPNLKEYRRFKIQNLGQDDPKCLAQILRRRFKHQEWVYPQAILIDGGKLQLAAALAEMKKGGLAGKIGLIGLVKGEEVVIVPKFSKTGKGVIYKKFFLPKNSPILKLLQRGRDEAHRFANSFLKRKTKKRILIQKIFKK